MTRARRCPTAGACGIWGCGCRRPCAWYIVVVCFTGPPRPQEIQGPKGFPNGFPCSRRDFPWPSEKALTSGACAGILCISRPATRTTRSKKGRSCDPEFVRSTSAYWNVLDGSLHRTTRYKPTDQFQELSDMQVHFLRLFQAHPEQISPETFSAACLQIRPGVNCIAMEKTADFRMSLSWWVWVGLMVLWNVSKNKIDAIWKSRSLHLEPSFKPTDGAEFHNSASFSCFCSCFSSSTCSWS